MSPHDVLDAMIERRPLCGMPYFIGVPRELYRTIDPAPTTATSVRVQLVNRQGRIHHFWCEDVEPV